MENIDDVLSAKPARLRDCWRDSGVALQTRIEAAKRVVEIGSEESIIALWHDLGNSDEVLRFVVANALLTVKEDVVASVAQRYLQEHEHFRCQSNSIVLHFQLHSKSLVGKLLWGRTAIPVVVGDMSALSSSSVKLRGTLFCGRHFFHMSNNHNTADHGMGSSATLRKYLDKPDTLVPEGIAIRSCYLTVDGFMNQIAIERNLRSPGIPLCASQPYRHRAEIMVKLTLAIREIARYNNAFDGVLSDRFEGYVPPIKERLEVIIDLDKPHTEFSSTTKEKASKLFDAGDSLVMQSGEEGSTPSLLELTRHLGGCSFLARITTIDPPSLYQTDTNLIRRLTWFERTNPASVTRDRNTLSDMYKDIACITASATIGQITDIVDVKMTRP